MKNSIVAAAALGLCLFAGYHFGNLAQRGTETVHEVAAADIGEIGIVELEDEAIALSAVPTAISFQATATAPGTLVKSNESARIDYSNSQDGYVMVCYDASADSPIKAQVKGPTTTYTYNLTAKQWESLPFSDGNGEYQITVYKNVSGTKYAAVLSTSVSVTLTNEFAPFLHSNQYVNYDAAPQAVALAAQLTSGQPDVLSKVGVVYDYVINNLVYDQQLAATVTSGYLPNLDSVLQKRTGICFDYASLMTGMLRSQGIPCKLVVGYAGEAYHSWINVWSESTGWVDGVIYFNGASWERMDPTFASSSKSSAAIMAYIGDGSNYTAKYYY